MGNRYPTLVGARARAALAATAVAAAACGSSTQPPTVRNLDRPTEMAFACYGGLRINGGDPDADGDIVASAQPLASCAARAKGEVPPGQDEREKPIRIPTAVGFALETARGTVAVVDADPAVNAVIDGDPLTPGKNSIPIGTLPVGIVPDGSGCFMVTANAGSCDLSELDVNSTLSTSRPAEIARVAITTPAGAPVLARPYAVAPHPQAAEIGEACPEGAQGLVYVAYPACHLVAAIDAATGQVRGGVTFGDGGAVSVTDGEVACPIECGDEALQPIAAGPLPGGVPDAGVPDAGVPVFDGLARPVAVTFGPDGKLYIGADNQSRLVVATLDAEGLPTAVAAVALEGDVGISRIAVSDEVLIGGAGDDLDGDVPMRFAYAIASDASVRVVELNGGIECDTQVDPRGLAGEDDPARLACLPVGAPDTPARRAGATTPGIVLPRQALPLDVTFALIDPEQPVNEIAPLNMLGTFAFVTTSDGLVAVVNIDDDRYYDAEIEDDPLKADLTLAMGHQLRDVGRDRGELSKTCSVPVADPSLYGPRLADSPITTVDVDRIAEEKTAMLPGLRSVRCEPSEGDGAPAAVSELSFAASDEVREATFPDLEAVKNEKWALLWEGPLSIDTQLTDVDGPAIRRALVQHERLTDPSGSLCQTGVEPFDTVTLLGCDPALGEVQCGVDETCYVHPDSPSVVTTGVCLPTDDVEELSGTCRGFLIGQRRYSVIETKAGELVLAPRRRILRTTPLDGCTSDSQCEAMGDLDLSLADPSHPIDVAPGADERSWTCGADPSRAPGVDRCMLSCTTAADCEPGTLCQKEADAEEGFCVEGVLPPRACTASVERYQLRVGDAFVLIGDRTGYLHRRIRDEASGACVTDPAASPLLVGRVPLRAAPCTDVPTPDPCATAVPQTERVTTFDLEGDSCVADDEVLRTRTAPAIRVATPALTMHVVDVETQGDAACIGDRAGEGPAFSTVYPGYGVQFELVAGYAPMFIPGIEAALPRRLSTSPDGRVWVIDQGDAGTATNGRIFSFNPAAASEGFAIPAQPVL